MFPIAVNGSAALTGTLAAGVATNVDLAVDSARRVVLLVKNTGGANALGTTAVSLSPNGSLFAEDTAIGTAVGSLAAGATALVVIDGLACHTLRLALTSSSGTTYAVEARGDASGGAEYVARVNGTVVGAQATTGTLTATTLKATGLTATRVPVVTTGGELTDDAGLTFNTTTNALAVTGAVSAGGNISTSAGTLAATVDDATTNASTVCATLTHTTSGTAAANIGAGLLFAAEDAGGNTESAVQLDGILTTATNAAEVSALVVKTRTGGGALAEAFRVAGNGDATAAGDLAAAGGFRQTVGPFYGTTAADQTATTTKFGDTAGMGWVAPRAGSLTAFSAQLDAAITGAGTNIVPKVYKNGSLAHATAILTLTQAGGEVKAKVTFAKDAIAFAAEDVLDVRYDSTTITNTPKLVATLEIEQ